MADRRNLLRGLAALPFMTAAGAAVPTRALASAADPFTTYHARILAIHAAIDAGPGDEAAERLMDVWGDIDREALNGRPTTLAGAAGALEYVRREFVQFQMLDNEITDDPSKKLIVHLLDGALSVLRQAAGGAR